MLKQYSDAVDEKFYNDGSVRYYPGITMVCHLEQDSIQHKICVEIQNRAKESYFSFKRTFLPPSSFHMTVFDLLCDERRTKEFWTCYDKERTEHLTKLVPFFKDKLKELSSYKKFIMVYDYLECVKHSGLTIRLKTKDDMYNNIIRNFRDEVSKITGIKQPNHDDYGFHISLDYPIEIITEKEEKDYKLFAEIIDEKYKESFGEIVFDCIDYCVFHDMYNFYPIDKIFLT